MRALAADRKGASAVAFAASAVVIMGFVGLATEAGTWYLGRRDAQNAADSAAMAAALATFYGGDPSASALRAAGLNGFSNGGNVTVSAAVQAASGTNPNLPVQVTVQQVVDPLISAVFGGTGITLGAAATAVVKQIGTACALATTGSLSVTGTMVASGCILASNASSSQAIDVKAGAALTALSVTAVGGCCGDGTLTIDASTGRPASPYHPSTTNPYLAADSTALPTFTAANCDRIPDAVQVSGVTTVTLVPYETSGKAYCSSAEVAGGGDLVVDGNHSGIQAVKVASGTYFFNNISLRVTGGTLTCAATCKPNGSFGTTFVFTGTTGNIGTVTITAGTVTLVPVKTNAGFPALGGMLFYGRGLGTATIVQANGLANQPISGGIYFPNSPLLFSGNVNSPSSCLSLVAQSITFYGDSGLDTTGCKTVKTSLANVQGVRLAQ